MPSNVPLTLFILRHGKASDQTNTDFDRPLTQRGQQQAFEKGLLLKQKAPSINTILCSEALRTRETLEYLDLNLKHAHIITDKKLYLCEPATLLMHIQQIQHAQSILLIGHNPGLHQFAYDLLPRHPNSPTTKITEIDALSASFPTCALAEFQFHCENWSDIRWHQGTLISYHH